MSQFIESLRRLYKDGKLTEERVIDFYNNGKITVEEKLYILAH